MALSAGRIHAGGETSHPWERAALDHVFEQLPDTDPHQVWPLHELHDASSGRLYEIDLLVLARGGLYLVEIKSHPGVLTGDGLDWAFSHQGRTKTLECPYRATNHKAKVLASLLDRRMGRDRPFVRPLVFLSHDGVDIRLDGGRQRWPWLVDRANVRKALVHGIDGKHRRAVNRPLMRQIQTALREIGLQQARSRRVVSGYRLGQLLDEGPGYQEHLGIHTDVANDKVRVRSYLVPHQTTTADQQLLERAARREARLLNHIGRHPAILSYRGFKDDGPLGPAVIFEPFEGGLPLHVFLRLNPGLSFDDRLSLIQQVVEALGHCHRNDTLHRNVSPASVLVRRADDTLQVRLHRFQAASQLGHSSMGTQHVDQLAEGIDRLYQAPEVLRDPSKADLPADMFSLGCLTWFVLTGQNPAPTLADRERQLKEHEFLRISAVRGDLAVLDRAMEEATQRFAVNRAHDVLEWWELSVLEELTRPEVKPEDDPDPHGAEHGTTLSGGLVVLRSLGSGGTARVLAVQRVEGRQEDKRTYALKVPHDDACAARLTAEADVLERLHHQHIVQLRGRLTLGGRPCLLLQYAGDSSLDQVLREEGTLGLDKARRFGDDLLSAIQHLEEQGITHRDLKPSNLGFTTLSRKAQHLVLFDFSLAAADPRSVDAGTPQWRDPWLYLRERWDNQADRYAAAAVLYRMLAGVRPEQAEDGPDQGRVRVEPERFDAAIRDRLARFFQRAFAEDIADRFPTTEDMRAAWMGLFASASDDDGDQRPAGWEDALERARLDTKVDALPLSARARNALDRAGVVSAAGLLRLPRNSLSAIRGVGSKVNEEIVQVAAALRQRLAVGDTPRLLADYSGPLVALGDPELGLPKATQRRLADAGLTTTTDAAAAPTERVERLVGERGAGQLRDALVDLAAGQPAPGSLAQWAHDLVEPLHRKPRREASQRVRLLLGFRPYPAWEGQLPGLGGTTAPDVASAFGIDPAQVHSSLQFMRKRWAASPACASLVQALSELFADLPPASPLEDVARALARRRLAGQDPDDDALRLAAALVRLALELRPAPPLTWRRVHGRAWVAGDPAVLDSLTLLGAAADDLAARDHLPSTETVRDTLRALVVGSPLDDLASDRLVALAAQASRGAAASARLELYPRGMSPDRALKLSLSVLTPPGLGARAVQDRVAARYPLAQPLPGRPDLDTLLHAHGLRWSASEDAYIRPGSSHPTTATIRAPTRMTSALPHQGRRRSEDAIRAQAFQDALDRGVERGRFRVVEVRADWAEQAAARLAEDLGVQPLSLDHALWQEVQRLAAEQEVDPAVLLATDRQGPGSPHWELLRELLGMAADRVIDRLLADRDAPRVLVHPGALARYQLQSPLQRLVDRTQHEEGAAVVLLVPCHDNTLAPTINGLLAVPAPLPGQRLRLPEDWLRNAHRAAAH